MISEELRVLNAGVPRRLLGDKLSDYVQGKDLIEAIEEENGDWFSATPSMGIDDSDFGNLLIKAIAYSYSSSNVFFNETIRYY